mgnify:CR=1 FL=1
MCLSSRGSNAGTGAGRSAYLTLAAICRAQLDDPPAHARVIVAAHCFPTGMLGYWVRKLADGGLVAALTATSPARLGHPDGGEHARRDEPALRSRSRARTGARSSRTSRWAP